MGSPPPELATPTPRIPPVPAGHNEGAQSSKIKGVPPGYVYIHTPLPNHHVFNLDAYAKEPMRDKDFLPDLLSHNGISTS